MKPGSKNYRFLLTRDKAVREVVRELLGEEAKEETPQAQAIEEIAEDQE